MGVDSAMRFLVRMSEEPAFRKRFIGLTDKNARLEFLKKEGFYFTQAECERAMGGKSGELTDEQLDAVSGGGAGYGDNTWNPPGQKAPCGW